MVPQKQQIFPNLCFSTILSTCEQKQIQHRQLPCLVYRIKLVFLACWSLFPCVCGVQTTDSFSHPFPIRFISQGIVSPPVLQVKNPSKNPLGAPGDFYSDLFQAQIICQIISGLRTAHLRHTYQHQMSPA